LTNIQVDHTLTSRRRATPAGPIRQKLSPADRLKAKNLKAKKKVS
jgi:hypothetical protein